MHITSSRAAVFAALSISAGFVAQAADDKPLATDGAGVRHAVAVLHPAAGGAVKGTLHFRKAAGGVRVQGTVSGLTPGAHGFHIHEFGDCSTPDFSSAGGHFNPTAEPHAAPDAAKRHEGDMGNIQAGADGSATLDYTDKRLDFDGGDSIVGRGVIVHEKPDDLKTQPTGDAGGRFACGVIGVAKPE